MASAERLFTDKAAAELLGLSADRVKKLRLARRIGFTYLDSEHDRSPRIPESELVAFQRAGYVEPTGRAS
jgi:hypothetical protein